MASSHPQPETTTMSVPSEIDWKQRCEQLKFEHQLELERIHLQYDHELKEKVAGKYLQKSNSSKTCFYI